ncbi:LOW QUALITY PROTEIN: F-box/LRR-repeat protein At1g06630-like [Arabidopsis lyrata subsp. lyrata]|uniref:LOW QUALITY PROTEIN: F-box/LRR-repeat protein At1g06630-like n=1 Tax=Arabidopsis lyrata subsp. lyrata TaxID=81972 RepID=UPI000A29C238|nr:LOW QUALITY PROTEIN: F-box/LRR-repeat protein At1g06630-like [Arabidopsis lyrata subsp. lyrata]|eukprot:XP_020882480.1 LOW QUALITY PROTEIN: F-box/LRR-repeat protein At1g06630-like [Arabidopsis lyrata subsp. lyrata]
MAATNFEKPCSGVTISCLPDEVLGKILSFLPTKQAVSTSLLSKKWTFMYRLADCLDFDDSLHLHAEEGEHVFPESFKNCVDRTLALQCDYSIKKFSLKCHIGAHSDCQRACVGRWISNVVGRGVVELDLQIIDWGLHFMPPQLFASKTLVKLTLGTALNLGKLPSDVLLPSLKFLFIDTVFFEYEDFCYVLLAGCPVLEELSVHHKNNAIPHTISSPTVKRLSVDYDLHREDELSFDLPNLEYLHYSDFALYEYPQVNLDSLVEAKLELYPAEHVERPDVTNLIMGIRNVEILHLSSASVEVIYSCCKYGLLLPVFNNLINLSLGIKNKRGWKLLAKMLKQCPKLETLNIQDLKGYRSDVSMRRNQVKLHILDYGGTDEEFEQLKSFLGKKRNAEAVVDDGIRLQTKRDITMLLGVSLKANCHSKVAQVI